MLHENDPYENGLSGPEIMEIRKKAGLTQEEFGSILKLTKRQVWSLEHRDKNRSDISDRIRQARFTRPRKAYGISGRQVTKLRKKRGLSQEELGKTLGLTKRQIWSMEHRESNSGDFRDLMKTLKPPGREIRLTGEHLKQIRELTGYSQSRFAKELGISQSTYHEMEHREKNRYEITWKVQQKFPNEFESIAAKLVTNEPSCAPVKVPSVGLTGVQIKGIRMFSGLTQAAFAETLGIKQPALSWLEHHGNSSVTLEQKIAERFPEEYYTVTARQPEEAVEPLAGDQVREIRLLLEMSQSAFAERLGVSQSCINDTEHKDRSSQTLTIKIKMAFPEAYEKISIPEGTFLYRVLEA